VCAVTVFFQVHHKYLKFRVLEDNGIRYEIFVSYASKKNVMASTRKSEVELQDRSSSASATAAPTELTTARDVPFEGFVDDKTVPTPFLDNYKWLYSFFSFGIGLLNVIRGLVYLTYISAGVATRFVVVSLTIAVIIDIATAFVVGPLSDRTNTAIGKRKPFFIASAVISIIGILGFAIGLNGDNAQLGANFVFFNALSYFGIVINPQPFNAWQLEQCASEAEYLKARSYYYTPFFFAGALSAVAIFGVFGAIGGAVIAGIIYAAALIGVIYYIKDKKEKDDPDPQPSIIPSIRLVWSNPLARNLLVAYATIGFGAGWVSPDIVLQICFDFIKNKKDLAPFILAMSALSALLVLPSMPSHL